MALQYEKDFVEAVKDGLKSYESACCFSFFKSRNKAYQQISAMLDLVDAQVKTPRDLRDTLFTCELAMEKSLKLHLGSNGATSARYDAEAGLAQTMTLLSIMTPRRAT